MIACGDCRHMCVPVHDDGTRSHPMCHHPKSFKELPEVLTGTMKTVAHSIEMMRKLGDCGMDAKLFDLRER